MSDQSREPISGALASETLVALYPTRLPVIRPYRDFVLHYSRIISSHLDHVDDICAKVCALLEHAGRGPCCFVVELLLREFLNNAIVHGNRHDIHKHVSVSVRAGREWIVLRVMDEGPGFDWRSKMAITPDELATSGRGLSIGVHYSERMEFKGRGNEVTLWVRTGVRQERE